MNKKSKEKSEHSKEIFVATLKMKTTTKIYTNKIDLLNISLDCSSILNKNVHLLSDKKEKQNITSVFFFSKIKEKLYITKKCIYRSTLTTVSFSYIITLSENDENCK